MCTRIYHILSLFVFITVLVSCGEDHPDCLSPLGKEEVELRSPGAFKDIELFDHLHYILQPDTLQLIEIIGPEQLITDIDVTIEQGIVRIKDNNACKWAHDYRKEVTVIIHSNVWRLISNFSTLSVECTDTIVTNHFTWREEQASSQTHLKLHTQKTTIESPSGYGDVGVEGITHDLELYSNSMGILDAKNLHSHYAYLHQSSQQDLRITCDTYLFALISNKGNIACWGNPVQVDLDAEGPGKLILH